MSIFNIWLSNNLSKFLTEAQIEEGLHNAKVIASGDLNQPEEQQIPTFTTNLNKITQDVLEAVEEDTSLKILVVHLKPTLIDRKKKPFGYQHRPRLEALKYLIQTIQGGEDQVRHPCLGVLVNLENPYCLRGFVVLDMEDADSNLSLKLLLYLGTPKHPHFLVHLYGEAYLPLESNFIEPAISQFPESDSIHFFSLFESVFLPLNELRLVNCLREIAEENGLFLCEIYCLPPPFDLMIEYSLIVSNDSELFEEMSEAQKLRLAEIAKYQEKFKGDSTYVEFVQKHFSRLRIIEKEGVINEDHPYYPEFVKNLEKANKGNLLLKAAVGQLNPVDSFQMLNEPFLDSLLSKAVRSYRFRKDSPNVSIVVVYDDENEIIDFNNGGFDSILTDLKLTYNWKVTQSSKDKDLVESRFRDICYYSGIDINEYEIFRKENLVFDSQRQTKFLTAYQNYYSEGYKYSSNYSSSSAINTLKSLKITSKSEGMKSGEDKNFKDIFNSSSASDMLSGYESIVKKELAKLEKISSEASEILNRFDKQKHKFVEIEDLPPKISLNQNFRSYTESFVAKFPDYKEFFTKDVIKMNPGYDSLDKIFETIKQKRLKIRRGNQFDQEQEKKIKKLELKQLELYRKTLKIDSERLDLIHQKVEKINQELSIGLPFVTPISNSWILERRLIPGRIHSVSVLFNDLLNSNKADLELVSSSQEISRIRTEL